MFDTSAAIVHMKTHTNVVTVHPAVVWNLANAAIFETHAHAALFRL